MLYNIAITFFTFILLIGVGVSFYLWRKSKKYTREKFAFTSSINILILFTTFISNLTNGISIKYIIVNTVLEMLYHLNFISENFLNKNIIQQNNLTPWETVVYLVIICFVTEWHFRIFKNWGGQKSILQHEQEERQEKPSISTDAIAFITPNSSKRKKLQPFENKSNNSLITNDLIIEKKTWCDTARMLYKIRNKNSTFDDLFDEQNRCWWGHDSRTKQRVILACPHHQFSTNEIIQLIEYLDGVRDHTHQECKIVIASKFKNEYPVNEVLGKHCVNRTDEEKLLENLVNFDDYFSDIVKRVENSKLPETEVTINDTFTESNLILNETSDTKTFDFFNKWLNESSLRHIALLGEYGQGKSTISLMLSYRLIKGIQSEQKNRIPILIELRGKSPRALTPEELFATWAYKFGIDVQALILLHLAGKLLLIFEGFDEMDLTGDSDSRLGHFRTLWKFAHEDSKLIITGRPNFFLDKKEINYALSVDSKSTVSPHCQVVNIKPFSIDQIDYSLRNIDESTRAEIISLAKKDKRFLEIISRPSLLFIVSSLWKKYDLSQKMNNITSAMIIELFIDNSYRRQGAKKDVNRDFMALNNSERAYFMLGISSFMAEKNLPNQISSEDLNLAIEKLVESIPDFVSKKADISTDETPMPLKSQHGRFDWENNRSQVIEHIKTDVRACGILVSDLSKESHFKFAHKSFMELLQSKFIYNLFSHENEQFTVSESIKNGLSINLQSMRMTSEITSFLADMAMFQVDKHGNKNLSLKTLFDIIVTRCQPKNKFTFLCRTLIQKLLKTITNIPFDIFSSDSIIIRLITNFVITGILVSPFALMVSMYKLLTGNTITSMLFTIPFIVIHTSTTDSYVKYVPRIKAFILICNKYGINSNEICKMVGSHMTNTTLKKINDN